MKSESNMEVSRSIEITEHLKGLSIALVGAWFLAVLGCSMLGAFDSPNRPPVALGAAVVLPVLAFAMWYLGSAEFRQFVQRANPVFLTLAHTWRVGGFVFLILYWNGLLPGIFALPAGWGDIAIGATAPLVAWRIASKNVFARRTFVLWNLLGLLDLVMAVTLGILASPTPFGILAHGLTTAVIGKFPMSLIPAFFVPLLIILHLISLARAEAANTESI